MIYKNKKLKNKTKNPAVSRKSFPKKPTTKNYKPK